MKNTLIIGCGGIGMALAEQLCGAPQSESVTLITSNSQLVHDDRFKVLVVSAHTEDQIASCLATVTTQFDNVYCCLGKLHDEFIQPEKNLSQWQWQACNDIVSANTLAPLCYLVHLQRLLTNECKLAFLSARVGSISDNALGGWYSYRLSKAAFNMALKTASIELKRTKPKLTIIAFHPGTTDTALSKPFQRNVPVNKLFTPAFSAECLLRLVAQLTPQDSGKFFAWDGQEIHW